MLTFLRMKPRELLVFSSAANIVYVFIPTKVTSNVDTAVLNIIHMFNMVTMYVIGISDRIFLSCN